MELLEWWSGIANFLIQNPAFFYLTAALLGLCVGSFLNVVIYRLPLMLERGWRQECVTFLELSPEQAPEPQITGKFNLSVPRSTCPSCKKLIRWWDNIPVISYLILGGKCRNCKTPISMIYPTIEAVTAILSVPVAIFFGFGLQAFYSLILLWGLIVMVMIDIDRQLLPDVIIYPLLWLGLFANVFQVFVSLDDAVLGAIAGYCSLWVFARGFKALTGKEGMGHGDFKLFALFGAWLGWQVLPFIILFSSLVGAVFGIIVLRITQQGAQTRLAFGPYLAVAGFVALFWGNDITHWYLQVSKLL